MKIVFIIGLPGSGKTTYLEARRQGEFKDCLFCDDYYKSAPGRTVEFIGSAYYQDLRKALANGESAVLADIVFCETDFREEALAGIQALLKELGIKADIELRFFENDPQACEANILRRGRSKRVEDELEFIRTHKDTYHIPEGAIILPVFKELSVS